MPVIQKTITICQCAKCDYEWEPRQPIEEIKRCPRCRTIYWNEARVPKWKKEESSQKS